MQTLEPGAGAWVLIGIVLQLPMTVPGLAWSK
jgi:hypothetical protein